MRRKMTNLTHKQDMKEALMTKILLLTRKMIEPI